MSLWYLSWRYLWQRPIITSMTIIGIVVGVALIVSVLTLKRETGTAFQKEAALFDLVVGAKGSPLQLTLSSVYHIDIPTGNIPYSRYLALKNDPRVRYAAPIGLGDNFDGFRIVGTEPLFFEVTRHLSEKNGREPIFSIQKGRKFQSSFETVLGYQVAQQTGLKIGDQFVGTHGLMAVAGSEKHKEFPYQVVGILNPTGTANDRAIYTPLDSVWIVHEKEERMHSHSSDSDKSGVDDEKTQEDGNFLTGKSSHSLENEKEVTSVLLQLSIPGMRLFLADEINTQTESMAAIPINQILRLYQHILLPIQQTLLAVSYLVVLVASFTVIIGLYQSTESRRRELALLRTLGSYRREVFVLVLFEAVWIVFLGVLFGWVLGHGAIQIGSYYFLHHVGLKIQPWSVDSFEITALLLVFLIGVCAGLIPAILNYRRTPLNDLSQI